MQDNVVINVLGIICCTFSIIGGLVIMLSYYKLPELKTFGNKMIMYVGMSNAIYAFQTLLEFTFDLNQLYTDDDAFDILCMIQGFISTYTSECMLVWITILSITIHDTVKNRIVNMAKRERIFIFLGFIIPLILSAIPFFTRSYGRQDNICWITDNAGVYAQNIQAWALFYGQLWICIFLNFGLIFNTMKMLKKLDITNTETYIVIRRFLYYPFLWIICWLYGTINRSIITAGGSEVQALMYITIVLTALQGFLTMIIFLSDKRILEAIKKRLNISKSQISNKDQTNVDGDAENPQDDSCNKQKLLDDEDDYFNYYNKKNKINGVNNDSNNSTQNNISNDFDCHGNQNIEQQQSHKDYVNTHNLNQKENHDFERNTGNDVQQQYTQQNSNYNNQKNNYRKKRSMNRSISQKQQFQTSGEWNKMEQIDEDSDEELFDREMQLNEIQNSEQLFLSRRDTKLLYKQRKINNSNKTDHLNKIQQQE